MPSAPQTKTAGQALRTSLITIPILCALSAPAQTLRQQYDKAQTLQSSGDMEQAAFAYQLFLSSAITELAEDRARLGDNAEAAKRYEEAYALRSTDPSILQDTARAERDAGNLPRAKELATRLLAAQAKTAAAHTLLGSILIKSGETDAAIKEYEAAVT